MRLSQIYMPLSALLSLIPSSALAADSEKPLDPCTIINPLNGAFYDLNTIAVQPLKDHKTAHKDDRDESWHARGYDYGKNFTINFCAPVIETLEDVVNVPKSLWKNVSAYYTDGESIYSIGQASTEPVFRGRKLVLNYTDGSYCDDRPNRLAARKLKDDPKDDDDDDEDHDKKPIDRKKPSKPSETSHRRKSSLISFTCDRDSLAPKAHINFIGASPDECTYFFEAKSMAACGGASIAPQTLGPSGVFGVIFLITAAVYLLGGIAYQRTVMHQRGWRQLPNYAIWAAIGNFLNVSLPNLTISTSLSFLHSPSLSKLNNPTRTSSSSPPPPAPVSSPAEKATTSSRPTAAAAEAPELKTKTG